MNIFTYLLMVAVASSLYYWLKNRDRDLLKLLTLSSVGLVVNLWKFVEQDIFHLTTEVTDITHYIRWTLGAAVVLGAIMYIVGQVKKK